MRDKKPLQQGLSHICTTSDEHEWLMRFCSSVLGLLSGLVMFDMRCSNVVAAAIVSVAT